MVKYYENRTLFQYSWDQVAQAFWSRYPNPESGHVLSEDVIFREIRGSTLFSRRLLTKTNRVPKWGERLINAPIVKIVEESVVDPEARTLTTYTRNLGYTRVMSLTEKVVYRVDDENPEWTVAERSAWVDSQVIGLARAIQAFGVERFKKNCMKMVRGFNFVLASMFPQTMGVGSQSWDPSLTHKTTQDKLKGAAKKATKLAKAGSIYVNCEAS